MSKSKRGVPCQDPNAKGRVHSRGGERNCVYCLRAALGVSGRGGNAFDSLAAPPPVAEETETLSFNEMLEMAQKEVLLDSGIIGYESYGSLAYDTHAYEELGIPKDEFFQMRWSDRRQKLSLRNFNCPRCHGDLDIKDIEERDVDVWQGTFADSQTRQWVHGTLGCEDCSWGLASSRDEVVIDSSFGEIVHDINDKWESLGFSASRNGV